MLGTTNEIFFFWGGKAESLIQFMDHVESWEDSWNLSSYLLLLSSGTFYAFPLTRGNFDEREVIRRQDEYHALRSQRYKHDIDNFSMWISVMCITAPDIFHILPWRSKAVDRNENIENEIVKRNVMIFAGFSGKCRWQIVREEKEFQLWSCHAWVEFC
jgi:hypothetical protein